MLLCSLHGLFVACARSSAEPPCPAAQVVHAFRDEDGFAKFAEWVREPDLDALREAQSAGKRKPLKRKAGAASSDEASDAGACLGVLSHAVGAVLVFQSWAGAQATK